VVVQEAGEAGSVRRVTAELGRISLPTRSTPEDTKYSPAIDFFSDTSSESHETVIHQKKVKDSVAAPLHGYSSYLF
jgi:hypothetical protein